MPSVDTPAHELVVVDVDSAELRDQCLKVRFAVFVNEQGFEADGEIDEFDKPHASFHLLLRLLPSLEPIGTARLINLSPTKKQLSRLCILKEYRTLKFGKELVLASHKEMIKRAQAAGIIDALEVSLHSQLHAKEFYAKCGYVEMGDEFDDGGAPHQKMVCRLSISQPT